MHTVVNERCLSKILSNCGWWRFLNQKMFISMKIMQYSKIMLGVGLKGIHELLNLNKDVDTVSAWNFVRMLEMCPQNIIYHKNLYQNALFVEITEFLLNVEKILWKLPIFRRYLRFAWNLIIDFFQIYCLLKNWASIFEFRRPKISM